MTPMKAVISGARSGRMGSVRPLWRVVFLDALNGILITALALLLVLKVGTEETGLILLVIMIADIPLRMIAKLDETSEDELFRPVFPHFSACLLMACFWMIEHYAALGTQNIFLVLLLWFLARLTFGMFRSSGSIMRRDTRVKEGFKLQNVIGPLGAGSDLLILPFLFSFDQMTLYLIASNLAKSVSFAIGALKMWGVSDGRPSVASARTYRAYFARFNLSVFLVGSGVAVTILGTGKIFEPIIAVGDVLTWLLLRYALPAFFGVYEDILKENGQETFIRVFQAGSFVALATIGCSLDITAVADFARTYAVIHFAEAFICAIILIRKFGIWPGPTAILFGGIRLG